MADSLKTPSGFHRKLAQVLGNGLFFFYSGHKELWPGLEPLPPAAYLPDGKFIESGFNSLGLKGMNTALRSGCYISTSKVSFKISPQRFIWRVWLWPGQSVAYLSSLSVLEVESEWHKPLHKIPVISQHWVALVNMAKSKFYMYIFCLFCSVVKSLHFKCLFSK